MNYSLLRRHSCRLGSLGKRGLSLIEIVAVMAILAIALGITAVSLRSTVEREGPRAMAHNLVSDLRAARAEASRNGKLVAFCLPSDGRTNAFSQTAYLRKGSQTGHLYKTLPYDQAYNGFIFTGTWPDSSISTTELPSGWTTATSDEFTLYFRADGTVFSNTVPSIEGSFALLVGSGFVSSGSGISTTVSAVGNPYTIWVSGSGNIRIEEGTTPVGALPPTDIEPNPAKPKLSSDELTASPKIEDIEFLPKGIPGSDTVGLGQNYVNIHPDQKESVRIEYGIATMLVTATDPDGGPLHFDLRAIASDGDRGNFTVSDETGLMDYVYDEATHTGKWQTLISWRPPPGAPEDTVYELQITVRDEQGHSDFTASGAGLIPKIANLPPARMVIQTEDNALYLANIEGSSTVKITADGEEEYEPFFSPDGTRIYSKRRTTRPDGTLDGGLELRVRNSDGSGLKVLRTFSPEIVRANSVDGDIQIDFDPTYEYAAYKYNIRDAKYESWEPVPPSRGGLWTLQRRDAEIEDAYELEVLHLNSGTPPIRLATDAYDKFFWDAELKHTLRFSYAIPHKSINKMQEHRGISRKFWGEGGHDKYPNEGVTLAGFPPVTETPKSDKRVDSTHLTFNLTQPEWFLDSPGVILKQAGSDDTIAVSNASISGEPNWSADGLFATYIEEGPGANSRIVVKKLLDTDFSPLSTPETKYTHSGPNISSAKLSPKGRWVFFIQNGKLHRAINAEGSTPFQIAGSLQKRIKSFAVSQ